MATANKRAQTAQRLAANASANKAEEATVEAPAEVKAAPKKAVAKKTVAKKAAVKKEAAPKVLSSTDPNHQEWQTLKKDLVSVMSDLLYDSRRAAPAHAKSRDEATAKVTAALKVLTEFTDRVRLPKA